MLAKLNISLFYLCLLFCIPATAQDMQQELDAFSGKFITAIKNNERATAFLITDKSIYKAGENIWFRGLLLNSVTQKIYTKCKYLFVDLVNEKDSVISAVILDAANQQLEANIKLPFDISSGYYWLRAYNRQIAEGDSNNCFVKPLYIISKSGNATADPGRKVSINKSQNPILKFYPEGGSIITGADSKVAFLIQTSELNPVVTEGLIKDNRDSIVAHFSSNKMGIGEFTFFPSSFRKYKAYIQWNGKEISYDLPPFNFYAAQLSVQKQAEGKVALRVLLEDSIYKKDLTTYVIGISKDILCFAGIGRGQYQLEVPEQKFSEGIATFYLFDSKFKFLSERSVYIKPNVDLLKTSVDKKIYGKRDKVNLSVSVTDINNHPVSSLFSIAVTDSIFSDPADDCLQPNLNNPELINNISMAHMQCPTQKERDLVMLFKNNTFRQNSRLNNKINNDYDSLFFIKGIAIDEKNKPAAHTFLTLFSNSGSQIFLTDTTDNNGRFVFPIAAYADNTQFIIEAKNAANKNSKIRIVPDGISLPHFKTPASLKRYFSTASFFTNRYKNIYLDSTFSIGKKLPPVVIVKKDLNYDVSKRVSNSSSIITSDKLTESNGVGNAVLLVGGVHMLNRYLVINGLTSIKSPDAGSEPLLLINGIEASPVGLVGPEISPVMSVLNSLNPNEIDFIEILKGAEGANYGLRGGNGVILVNMAGSRKDNYSKGNNLQTFYAKGISTPTFFPLINYDNKAIRSSENLDNRSTIFWDGSVVTGNKNIVNISFFTNDIPATYKVVISGITVNGDIIYKDQTFKTK